MRESAVKMMQMQKPLDVRDYNFIYQCRMCGKKFVEGTTRTTQMNIIKVLCDYTEGKSESDVLNNGVQFKAIHYCECSDAMCYGIADFIGITPSYVSLERIAGERP